MHCLFVPVGFSAKRQSGVNADEYPGGVALGALQAYIDQTQPYRKQAAQAGETVPGKAGATPAAEKAVRTRTNVLADALKTSLRPAAKPGAGWS